MVLGTLILPSTEITGSTGGTGVQKVRGIREVREILEVYIYAVGASIPPSMIFKSLAKLFKYHHGRHTCANAVEKDLAVFLKQRSVTSLVKEIKELAIHIGTWKKFKSKTSLRSAIHGPDKRYQRFPLEKAKEFKVIKACLVHVDHKL